MSSFSVIKGATITLSDFLADATSLPIEYDKAPDDSDVNDGVAMVHIFLYRVEVSPFFVNDDWQRPSSNELREPPIGLNLLYLFTPYGKGQTEIQATLGQIIQAFHQTPIIPASFFHPTLADTTQELRVVPRPLSLEQTIDFWRSYELRTYRLAVSYEVSVVLIDSAASRMVVPVEEREVGIGTLR